MSRTPKKPARDGIWQLRIVLRDVSPPVWRRIQVRSATTLAELHAIVQDVMGWQNYHLWEFIIGPNHYEAPDPEASGHDATTVKLKDLDVDIGSSFDYVYDPGDDWQHEVVVEDRLAPQPDVSYPVCTGGARACPPEDSGGPHRYGEILEILQNPAHPDFSELSEWLAEGFQPETFDLRATNRILMLAFGGGGAV